jgi:hypothetical protein
VRRLRAPPRLRERRAVSPLGVPSARACAPDTQSELGASSQAVTQRPPDSRVRAWRFAGPARARRRQRASAIIVTLHFQ